MAKLGSSVRPPAKLAIVGEPNSGKTVFICSNVALPVWALDADGRFGDYQHLLLARSQDPGETPDDLSVYVDPARLYSLSRDKQKGNAFKAVVVDSMTKPFQGLARSAHLINRAQKRGEVEGGGNFADRLQEKAMFISMISSISALFEETWLVWHTYQGKGGKGEDRTGETISKVERDRLLQSLSARIEFGTDAKGYWASPTWARDWRGIKANVGFKVYDKPDNYWKGGLDRLFSVMYASFKGKDEAIAWAVKVTGMSAEELSKIYETKKEGVKSAADMWARWALHVESM